MLLINATTQAALGAQRRNNHTWGLRGGFPEAPMRNWILEELGRLWNVTNMFQFVHLLIQKIFFEVHIIAWRCTNHCKIQKRAKSLPRWEKTVVKCHNSSNKGRFNKHLLTGGPGRLSKTAPKTAFRSSAFIYSSLSQVLPAGKHLRNKQLVSSLFPTSLLTTALLPRYKRKAFLSFTPNHPANHKSMKKWTVRWLCQ